MTIQIPILIDPSQIWVDSRGSFTESYNQRRLSGIGIDDILFKIMKFHLVMVLFGDCISSLRRSLRVN